MPRTYSKELLDSYKAKDYEYNGQKMTEYDALQQQRSIERNLRRWKRENMSEGEKTQILSDIFNKVDLKSAQALLAGCGEEFDNLDEAITNSGAMQNMADTQLDNLKGDLTILQSGLEGAGNRGL